jgi:hypothetical protein
MKRRMVDPINAADPSPDVPRVVAAASVRANRSDGACVKNPADAVGAWPSLSQAPARPTALARRSVSALPAPRFRPRPGATGAARR